MCVIARKIVIGKELVTCVTRHMFIFFATAAASSDSKRTSCVARQITNYRFANVMKNLKLQKKFFTSIWDIFLWSTSLHVISGISLLIILKCLCVYVCFWSALFFNWRVKFPEGGKIYFDTWDIPCMHIVLIYWVIYHIAADWTCQINVSMQK